MAASIAGVVTAGGGEPRLPVSALGVSRSDVPDGTEIEAVVDTGFDGESQLPPELVRRLGYPYEGSVLGALADGSEGRFDYHLMPCLAALCALSGSDHARDSVPPSEAKEEFGIE